MFWIVPLIIQWLVKNINKLWPTLWGIVVWYPLAHHSEVPKNTVGSLLLVGPKSLTYTIPTMYVAPLSLYNPAHKHPLTLIHATKNNILWGLILRTPIHDKHKHNLEAASYHQTDSHGILWQADARWGTYDVTMGPEGVVTNKSVWLCDGCYWFGYYSTEMTHSLCVKPHIYVSHFSRVKESLFFLPTTEALVQCDSTLCDM